MSGKKVREVTIPQSVYDNLLKAESDLKRVNSAMPKALEALRAESQSMINGQSTRFDCAIGQVREQVSKLDQSIIDHENRMGVALNSLNRSLGNLDYKVDGLGQELRNSYEHFEGKIKQMRQEVSDLFVMQSQHFSSELNKLENRFSSEINKLDDRLGIVEDKHRQAALLVDQWVKYAQIQQEHIKSHYRHERFLPGRLAQESLRLDSALKDHQAGLSLAALSAVREVAFKLNELRADLETYEQEWIFARLASLEQARNLYERLKSNKFAQAIDLEGKLIPVDLDIDYWSCGCWSVLEKELSDIIRKFEDKDCALTTSELRSWLQNDSISLDTKLEEMMRNARLTAIASQQRYDMAVNMGESMKSQGFSIDEVPLFEAHDMRKSILTRLKSFDGAEMVIRVSPVEQWQNKIEINSFDHNKITDNQMRIRSQGLDQVLSASLGLEIKARTEQKQPDQNSRMQFEAAKELQRQR
jgi:hypothetical protein